MVRYGDIRNTGGQLYRFEGKVEQGQGLEMLVHFCPEE